MVRIVFTGSGSGGHVTPLKSIMAETRQQLGEKCEIVFVGKRGDQFNSLLDETEVIDRRKMIFAGKWRRYPNETTMQRIFDLKTHVLNIRDLFQSGFGLVGAMVEFIRNRPDVVFSKGGPSAVPVGMAAALLRIPLITHDSDAIPGWAHRLVGRWAKLNLVGTASAYPYPKARTKFVGVPILDLYENRPTNAEIAAARTRLGISKPLVFVFGGSLGATAINTAVLAVAKELDANFTVVHMTGETKFEAVQQAAEELDLQNYTALPFIASPKEVYDYYIAATVVVSRAGATNTAEIAATASPAVIIPAQQLADQQVNSVALKERGAAVLLSDEEILDRPQKLLDAINEIQADSTKQQALSDAIYELARPHAARDIAQLIRQEVE